MARSIDLTGTRFGKLTVVKRGSGVRTSDGTHRTTWICQCDCGNFIETRTSNLKNGNAKSCGCLKSDIIRKKNDLTGQKFGKLTAIRLNGFNKYDKAVWECLCDCGNTTYAIASQLKSGHTSSCGCYRLQRDKECNTTHGGRKTRLYKIWAGMKSRCFNSNDTTYKYYGARGIIVCDEWKTKYESFRDWANNNGYTDIMTIDRIDVNGNYEPNNCRWITQAEQANNKTNNVFIEYKGERKTVSQWARETGIKERTIRYGLAHNYSANRIFLNNEGSHGETIHGRIEQHLQATH